MAGRKVSSLLLPGLLGLPHRPPSSVLHVQRCRRPWRNEGARACRCHGKRPREDFALSAPLERPAAFDRRDGAPSRHRHRQKFHALQHAPAKPGQVAAEDRVSLLDVGEDLGELPLPPGAPPRDGLLHAGDFLKIPIVGERLACHVSQPAAAPALRFPRGAPPDRWTLPNTGHPGLLPGELWVLQGDQAVFPLADFPLTRRGRCRPAAWPRGDGGDPSAYDKAPLRRPRDLVRHC